jgi:IclR family transcriptional regulator, mhp operon transcriptional activator
MRDYKVKSIHALSRGLDVLLTLQKMRVVSLHDLHRKTGYPKSSLTRILRTLNEKGLVWQRLADGAYMPSHRLSQHLPTHDTDSLVEVASPFLEKLCQKVQWPSVLSVPRLDYMEVIETNSPKAAFHLIVGPVGVRVDILRSATGRAYFAFCDPGEREAVLSRLREKSPPGPHTAWDMAWIDRVVRTTRARGYSTRDRNYSGVYNDDRDSIAVPVMVAGNVVCCVNLTWRARVMSTEAIVGLHIGTLQKTATMIQDKLAAGMPQGSGTLAATVFKKAV